MKATPRQPATFKIERKSAAFGRTVIWTALVQDKGIEFTRDFDSLRFFLPWEKIIGTALFYGVTK